MGQFKMKLNTFKHFPKDLDFDLDLALVIDPLHPFMHTNLSLEKKALPTTFLPSVKTLTKNISIYFLSTGSFFRKKVFWDSVVTYSYRSVGIHDFTCYGCVCKEKQDSRRG